MRAECILHGLREEREPTDAQRLVDPAEDPEPAPGVERPGIVGAEPSRPGERGVIRCVPVPRRELRAGQPDAALVVVDLHRHPRERGAVVHTSARGLAHAVGPDHPDAGVRGAGEQLRCGRGPAEQDRVELGERGHGVGRAVVEDLGQLTRDERGVRARAAAPGRGPSGPGPGPGPGPRPARGHRVGQGRGVEPAGHVHHDRLVPGAQRPQDHLQPGDVVRGQREQPPAGPAEHGVGRFGGGGERGGREHRPLGRARRPGRAHHQCGPVIDRVTGALAVDEDPGAHRVVGRHRQQRRPTVGEHLRECREHLGDRRAAGDGQGAQFAGDGHGRRAPDRQ